MNSFVHVHSSSRFDRSVESLEKAVSTYNDDADLVTYTEVEFTRRKRAVREANGKTHGFIGGDSGLANDCGISYKKDRFDMLYAENFKASDLRIFSKSGLPRAPIHATIAVLKDKTNGNKVVVAVIHLPSSVEGDLFSKKATRRTAQWFNAFRNTKRRVNRLRRTHKAAAGMIVADFNVDFKKRWVRALVKSLAPTYRSGWVNTKVSGGTHGHRIIDATLMRGRIAVRHSSRLYPDDASSDHRPYVETLRWLDKRFQGR